MIDFDESQVRAIESALKALKLNKAYYRIGGYAGTGKTTIAMHIAEQSKLAYKGAAFAGKAASQLRKKGIKNSETLHKTMYHYDDDTERFYRKSSIGCDLLILDEGSMVPSDLWEDALSFRVPIIVLGDPAQLEPIGSDDAKLMHNPDIVLEKIHRYEGSIAWFANQIRLTGNIPRIDNNEVSVLPKSRFMTDLKAEIPSVVLCGFNKTRVATNKVIRDMKFPGRYKKLINEGERLICLKNNRDLGIFNGQMMDVLNVEKDCQHSKWGTFSEARVRLDDDTVKMLKLWHGHLDQEKQLDWRKLPEKIATVDYGYATTVHKFQGSEDRNVMIIDEQAPDLWSPIRHRYTAATRAQERLRMYVN